MIKNNILLLLLFGTSILFTSCLNRDDEDNIQYTNDAALSGFSVNNILCWKHVTTSSGADSVYSTTLSTTAYKFNIDQRNGLVYNLDSLPKGCRADKVVCAATAYGNGTVAYKQRDNDTIYALSSTDTMDFTYPVEFRVYPADGTDNYRKYTVSVNIHQEEGDSMRWTMVKNDPNLAAENKKVFFKDNRLFLFKVEGQQTNIIVSDNGTDWYSLVPDITLDEFAYNNTVIFQDDFYTLTDGAIYKSEDAVYWNKVSEIGLDALVAAGSVEMYGIRNKSIFYSRDKGMTWEKDLIDVTDTTFLPEEDFSYAVMNVESNAETEKIIILGNRSLEKYPNDIKAMVWVKTYEKREKSERYPWMRSVFAPRLDKQLPRVNQLPVAVYDGDLFACVSKQFYISEDQGLVWNKDTKYTFPTDFDDNLNTITMVSDESGNMWLISQSGNVWKARINCVGWKENETAFKK